MERVNKIYRDAREAVSAEEKATRNPRSLAEAIAKAQGNEISIEKLLDRKEKRMLRRERALPKDRRCPNCKLVKLNRTQWIVVKGRSPLCRSCYRMAGKKKNLNLDFTEEEATYIVSPQALENARIEKGLSAQTVARVCGWSPSKQSKLEAGTIATISLQEYTKLSKLTNVYFTRSPRRFRVRRKSLKRVRNACGVSLRDFAKHLNWLPKKLERIENGTASITENELLEIQQTLERIRNG